MFKSILFQYLGVGLTEKAVLVCCNKGRGWLLFFFICSIFSEYFWLDSAYLGRNLWVKKVALRQKLVKN